MKTKNLLIIFVSLISLGFVSAQQYNCPGFGMMGGYGYSVIGVIFGWLFMGLVLIAIILLIAWLIKQLQKDGRRRR